MFASTPPASPRAAGRRSARPRSCRTRRRRGRSSRGSRRPPGRSARRTPPSRAGADDRDRVPVAVSSSAERREPLRVRPGEREPRPARRERAGRGAADAPDAPVMTAERSATLKSAAGSCAAVERGAEAAVGGELVAIVSPTQGPVRLRPPPPFRQAWLNARHYDPPGVPEPLLVFRCSRGSTSGPVTPCRRREGACASA